MVAAHIGLKIRERRKEIGLSQTELAGRIGISVSYLNLIEHNKRSIGGRLLRQVADEIGVGLEMLDGATERRLASDLTEVIADPLFDRMRPEPQAIDGLVGRYRSEEHTSELQSLMRSSYAVFCLKKKKHTS